jgi:hypothetical protein
MFLSISWAWLATARNTVIGLETPSRIIGGKTKLRDDAVFQNLLEQHELVDPKQVSEELLTVVDIEHVILDTTGLSVEETVKRKWRMME